MKKFSTFALSAALILGGLPVCAAENPVSENPQVSLAASWKDVDPNAWYMEFITQAADKGIIKGYDNGNYGPNDVVTRGMFAQMMYNLFVIYADPFEFNPYPDLGDIYYHQAAVWANMLGFMKGYADGTFGGENPVKRQDFVTVLYRALSHARVNDTIDTSAQPSLYPDFNQTADYAKEATAWAAARGIIGGNGSIKPNDSTTRAEAAKMLLIYKNLLDSFRK